MHLINFALTFGLASCDQIIGAAAAVSSTPACLSKHDVHKLNTELDTLNHKWTGFISSLISTGISYNDQSNKLDEINDQMKHIKEMSTMKPCESSSGTTTIDLATNLMNTIQDHFDILMHPGDASHLDSKLDTGGYQYQGGSASYYAPPGQDQGQGYYGSNGNGYYPNQYGSPQYQQPYGQQPYGQQPYGQYPQNPYNGLSNRYPQQPQQQPYGYQGPQGGQGSQPPQAANSAPALSDKQGNFILRFAERIVETVLFQLEVIGGVFSSQRSTKNLSIVSDLEKSAKGFAGKLSEKI